jgi:O-antigen ligase
MHKLLHRARVGLVCFSALSVSLPIAWISLAKVLLFMGGLGFLLARTVRGAADSPLTNLWTARVVLLIVLSFGLRLWGTDVDAITATTTYIKHGKLLSVLLLVCLIHTAQEARWCLVAFLLGQAFLIVCSWLLFVGVPISWAVTTGGNYVVFSTYLDQSIMLAASAGLFWHMRHTYPAWHWIAVALAIAALLNVLVLLDGRTGYVVAAGTIGLAVMWAVPKRVRVPALLATPVLVLLGLSLASSNTQERITKIFHESRSFSQQTETLSSSGWRLNAWHRSLQALAEKPLLGYGTGGWTPAVKHFEGATADQTFGKGNSSNPHQEYLLWGVELGIGGVLLLLALWVAVLRDALRFAVPVQRATHTLLAAMTVACLFNSSLYDDLMGDFWVVSLGILMALGVRSMSTTPPQGERT